MAAKRTAEIAAIEKDCRDYGLRCEVVSLYSGGEYWLYRFKRYTDIRLVMAPEEQAAFFGGDYDNFVYPRHDLDFTFLRAYENDKPASDAAIISNGRATGAADGEFILVSGYPGSTARLLTDCTAYLSTRYRQSFAEKGLGDCAARLSKNIQSAVPSSCVRQIPECVRLQIRSSVSKASRTACSIRAILRGRKPRKKTSATSSPQSPISTNNTLRRGKRSPTPTRKLPAKAKQIAFSSSQFVAARDVRAADRHLHDRDRKTERPTLS